MIRVAIGLAVNSQGKIFMGRRRANKRLGGAWECPGGKAEPGEHVVTALGRELHEELGVLIGPRGNDWRVLGSRVLELDVDLEISLIPFMFLTDPPPESIDHDVFDWVTPHGAVRELCCTPGFYAQYRLIRDFAKNAARA